MEGKRNVIHELEQGKEDWTILILKVIDRSLISEILSSYQKAISLLNPGGGFPAPQTKFTVSLSPQNEGFSDMDFKNVFKKRKISEKESEKVVKVCVGKGQDGACIEDGYCWRKYGQKEILGSKNPRGYYRCTRRFSQGCLAVKQVQRSDTDPSVFEVKYLGTHTCDDVTPATAAVNHASVRETERKPEHDTERMEEDMMLSLVEIENKKAIFRTFSFSKAEPENAEWKSEIFPENLMEKWSPATSGSVITTSELMSAPTSVTNSPTGDPYLSPFIDLDADFSFDSYLDLLS
ncbi:PREDICTED: probable WRKY transcription factor 46 [Tarenaya hassleriana]|uniref:probable WRKY transcription factor 46 n=1 Tax=Tarenaya hassleriana TaxID=28532 RepID=UPI00053C843C|nr:PREDICTED: probable WRKY transcription factor 46 [Tarenaya hassleriana]